MTLDHRLLPRHLVDASMDGMFVFDASRRVVLCNDAGSLLIGRARKDIIGALIEDLLPDVAKHLRPSPDGEVLPAGALGASPADADITVRLPSGWTVSVIPNGAGGIAGWICTYPCSTLTEAVRQLRESERRLRDFVESASDWFWETDEEFRYKYLSDRYQEATGLPPESRLGQRRGNFRLSGPTDGDWSEHLADLQAHRPFRDFTFAYLDANDLRRVARVSGRPVFDDNGVFRGYRGVGRDITTEVEAQERIRFLAQHDALTGLPNRMLLMDRLQQALASARRMKRRLGILCIDLDDFKAVNDMLGHAAGDALLCETAKRMFASAREMDTVARLGGDEFTIIQTEIMSGEDVGAFAARLIERIREPVLLGGERVHCGASIGISLYPDDGENASQLLRHADLALYKAKSVGHSQYCFFTMQMNDEICARRQVEQELFAALNNDDLHLYFQPQLNIATGEIVCVEVLLRWLHPQRGMVTPDTFIPIAERSGLILSIDRWVLRQACRQARQWLESGLLMGRIAVNLSAVSLARDDLVHDLVSILTETGLNPKQLEIEITESVLLTDTDTVASTLGAIHDLGIGLALDDFGTGYSSLTYLRRFPVDKVKIDQSFIRNPSCSEDDAVIARAIISLGHSLGLQVVAEGVETAQQLEFLRHEGCDEAQGYHLARPMNATDCANFLRHCSALGKVKLAVA